MTGLAVLESTLRSFCLSYKVQDKEATVTVLTVSAVMAVIAVLVVTVTPHKTQPPFSDILKYPLPLRPADSIKRIWEG